MLQRGSGPSAINQNGGGKDGDTRTNGGNLTSAGRWLTSRDCLEVLYAPQCIWPSGNLKVVPYGGGGRLLESSGDHKFRRDRWPRTWRERAGLEVGWMRGPGRGQVRLRSVEREFLFRQIWGPHTSSRAEVVVVSGHRGPSRAPLCAQTPEDAAVGVT